MVMAWHMQLINQFTVKTIFPIKKTADKETLSAVFLNGAGEEIRTLDPNLGKVVLYP